MEVREAGGETAAECRIAIELEIEDDAPGELVTAEDVGEGFELRLADGRSKTSPVASWGALAGLRPALRKLRTTRESPHLHEIYIGLSAGERRLLPDGGLISVSNMRGWFVVRRITN